MKRTLLVLICLLIAIPSYGMNPKWADTFKKNLWIIIDRHPRYTWGGAEDEAKGVDCSGYLFLAAKRSGIPVKRTTALEMRNGLGGWLGEDTDLEKAGELDVIWWTWKSKPGRPHGHVGVFIIGRQSDLLEVTHSGSSTGVTHHQLYGTYLSDISAIRRLTIGEKPQLKLGPGIKKIR